MPTPLLQRNIECTRIIIQIGLERTPFEERQSRYQPRIELTISIKDGKLFFSNHSEQSVSTERKTEDTFLRVARQQRGIF